MLTPSWKQIPVFVAIFACLSAPVRAQTEEPPPPEEAQEEAQVAEPAEGTEADALPEEPAGPDLSEVNELILEGSYAEAETTLNELAEEFPENATVLMAHGEVLLALRKPDEAKSKLEQSIALDAERPRAHFQLAAALSMLGEDERALEEFARELELNQDVRVSTLARLNRSMLLGRTNDWAGAAVELEEALKLDNAQIQMYGDLASLYIQAGDLDAARNALDRGAEVGFLSAGHYYSLGARLYADKRDEEAIETFGRTLEIDGSMAPAERSMAAALERTGRTDEALEHLQRYLELAPDAPDAAQVSDKIKQSAGS